MFVGISPGRHEMQTGKPFTGQSGNLIRNILEAVGRGLTLDQCYATNLCCTTNIKPSLDTIMGCYPRLLREIQRVKPKLIVALGLITAGVFYPDRKFGDVRGCFDWHPTLGCWILVTNHTAAVLYEDNLARHNQAADIVSDFKKIAYFLRDNPHPSRRHIEYEVVDSHERAQTILNDLPLDIPIAVDIETDNKEVDTTDPHSDSLICIGLSDGERTWILPRSVCSNLTWPKAQWTFHYGTFDAQQILKTLGVDLTIVHDTLLLHNCIEERSGHHKLKPLLRAYEYEDHYEEKVKKTKTNMRRAQPDELYLYNAKDARGTARLVPTFTKLAREDNTYQVYTNLLLPAVNTFKKMQYRGVPFSKERALELAGEWLPLYRDKHAALKEMVREAGGDPEIDFGSPQQLSKFLYGNLKLPRAPGGNSTDTDKEILATLAEHHPFPEKLIDYRHLSHLLTTYVFGVIDDIKNTGRIHPSPSLHGTNSGRCSYSGPAINTIPRPYTLSPYGPSLRKLFAAEPGYVILELDYRQAELWQAAIYSGDANMWADLRSGDFHRQTAAFIHQCAPSLVRSDQRSDAKPTNFGKLYRIGDDKLSKQIKRDLREAHNWSVLWDERYRTYVDWGESLFTQLQETGEIVSFTGRKFRWPLVLDRSILSAVYNAPIQGTSHDYILDSIIQGYDPLYNDYGAEIMLDIHDAILIHCPADHWEAAARRMKEIMEQPRFGLPMMPTEIKVGPSWGEVKEVELAA